MPSLFDRLRGQGSNQDGERPRGRYRSPDWAEEFASPVPPGRLIVRPDTDPWQVLDDRGAVRLLCDRGASVRTINGDRLLSLAPDVAGTIVPRTSAGVIGGMMDLAFGAALGTSPQTGMPYGTGFGEMRAWVVRETAGLVIARVDARTGRIELLPSGALNSKLVARRFPAQLATTVRALGPLTYTIVQGAPLDGAGQLRGPAGQLVATDRFAYRGPVRRSGALHHELDAWTIQVHNNPFPIAWLVSLLRATKMVN